MELSDQANSGGDPGRGSCVCKGAKWERTCIFGELEQDMEQGTVSKVKGKQGSLQAMPRAWKGF